MNFQEELVKVREGVEAEVFKQEECPAYTTAEGGLLGKIREFPADSPVPALALGTIGPKVAAFAKAIDCSHPDLVDFLGGAFMPGHDFCETAEQLLQAANICHASELTRVVSHFAKIAEKVNSYDVILQRVDSPSVVLNHLRYVPSQEQRDELRKKQKSQEVNMGQIVQQGPVVWDPLPASFSLYVRNKHPYGDDIERCKKRAAVLIENGCPEMAGKITSRIQTFEEQIKDRYYDFNRVTVVNAAVICAKMLKCELVSGTYGKSHRISVSNEFCESVQEKMDVTLVGGSNKGINYEPRLYPVHNLSELLSENTKKIMNHLENFPATGGRPIFDHFWALVPSVSIAHIPTTDIVKNKLLTDGVLKFDAKLIETKVIMPVLLGEKCGKMYFLDYID